MTDLMRRPTHPGEILQKVFWYIRRTLVKSPEPV